MVAARMLTFDCRGSQRLRLEEMFDLQDSIATPFYHTFKELLARTPGAFTWEAKPVNMPAVLLLWNSMFRSIATAHLALGGQPAARFIFASGQDRRTEAEIIAGEADSLARYPASTFRWAYDAFAATSERPMVGIIELPAIDDEIKRSVTCGIHRSLALAFFKPASIAQPESLVPPISD